MRDALRALKLDKAAAGREAWSRDQLLEWQRDRVDAIVRHAAQRSPF